MAALLRSLAPRSAPGMPRPIAHARATPAHTRAAVDATAPSGILRGVSQPPVSASPALSDAPVVAHVVRGGFVESVHHGTAVVTAPDGSVELEIGDSSGPVFPRSSSKPLQGLAMVRSGLATDGRLLALACASHSGEDFHVEAAREILAGAGLTETDLQNTPDYPYDDAARIAWIA